MSKRSDQIFEELLVEYADENLQVQVEKDLLSDLKINKTALTRFVNNWIGENKAKWIGTNTIQLMMDEAEVDEVSDDEVKSEIVDDSITTDSKSTVPSTKINQNDVATIPRYMIDIIGEMIEKKLNTKLTKEMQLLISKKVSNFEIWERTIKNILFDAIPENTLLSYIDYIINTIPLSLLSTD